ncbi:MAG: MarR family transcriptional regulator [Gemmatimonadaceae bacterium]|jgi:DNA-binding MarR family transcriptional regulator|nr:MarR family transcriptional regulator [Gemmatimonadaceae bacterium]
MATTELRRPASAPTTEGPRPLQAEIAQTRPFSSTAVEAVLGIERTADLLQGAFAAALKPHGVSPTQYNVLRILRGAGEHGLPTLEIGHRMVTREPDVPRLIDRMEKAGLVTRRRCTADRRVVWCALSAQGASLMSLLDPIAEGLPVSQMSMLSAEEQRTLVTLLDRVRAGARG